MYRPNNMILKKHYDILLEISDKIKNRLKNGNSVELIKVKGHSNIIGNDMADILANMARDYNHDAELIEILDNPRTRGYWVKTNITNSDGTHSKRHINNLNDDLCKHCTKQLGKGHSNRGSHK